MASCWARSSCATSPKQAETGIVDQDRELKPGGLQRLRPSLATPSGWPRSAAMTRGRGMALCRDGVGQRVQFRLAPRRQHQFMTVAGELVGQRHADAGRGAGDQAYGLRGWNLGVDM